MTKTLSKITTILGIIISLFLAFFFIHNQSSAAAQNLHIAGNHLVDGSGNQIVLRGAARWSMEFSCGDGHFGLSDFQAMKSWGMNIVRIPLNENYYLNPALCNNQYITMLSNAVANAKAAGLYVLLDLHWIHPVEVNNVDNRGGQFPMPDLQAKTFWQSLAAKYANDPQVLYEFMNEPHPADCNLWKNGGTVNSPGGTGWINQVAGTYTGVGFQELVNIVRATGANNMIIQGASGEADISCAVQSPLIDPANNLIYQSHFYHTDPNTWKSKFQSFLSNAPVIAGEYDAVQAANVLPVFENQLHTGYIAWAWHTGEIITDYTTGQPTSAWQSVHDFILNASRNSPSVTYASTPTLPPIGSGGDIFSINICPHGLGNCGDNVNSSSGGNINPKHPSRNIILTILNNSGQPAGSGQGNISYNSSSQHFTGRVSIANLSSGQYLATVKIDGFLSKQLPGIITFTKGQTTTLPSISLVTGDINNDNQLSLLDYNIIVACFGSKQNTSSCPNPPNPNLPGADISDDGIVDGIDYNLLLRELSVQKGSGGNPTATITLPSISPTPTISGNTQIPPIGWNHYNHFGNGVNETLIKSIADSIAINGMKSAGYQYVNIDDSWQGGRDAQGNITANSNYPSGIKALADYIHSKGLKFGLYTTPANTSCAGKTGSGGHFDQDVATFASWGVDYIKLDWCGADYSAAGASSIVQQWQTAIKNHGRPMMLSINAGGNSSVGSWAKNYPPITWRTGDDICASWFNKTQAHNSAARDCFNTQYHNGIYDYIYSNIQNNIPNVGPGHWGDADMLEVGNPGLSFDEEKTHFSMWAMWSASLIAGNDPRSMNGTDDASLILLNKEVIAIDQDPAGVMANKIQDNGGLQVWSKNLATRGSRAVALVNTTNNQAVVSFSWSSIGLTTVTSLHDLWLHQDIQPAGSSYNTTIPAHGTVMLKVTGN